ncbi:MAG: hypothetical protein KatS3mg105_0115 [Gemmatales bacterium]|nr:MAG: hypothetical protein KatS3mg105_0115 [Gemmatales bacterium]
MGLDYRWLAGALALVFGMVMGCTKPTAPRPSPTGKGRLANGTVIPQFGLAGTASCSGRSCHGSIAAKEGQDILQNEHTIWITRDPHSDAFRVLFNERSKIIARNLGLKSAHQSERCLACHTNPFIASEQRTNEFTSDERFSGVGCESCHGNAEHWLAAHTTKEWSTFNDAEKARYGMRALNDLTVRVRTCAQCHIGAGPNVAVAPPASADGVPVRDVNHDLIAAGHPRLDFEFAAYMANMPPHWNVAKKKPDEWKNWSVGQLVSTQTALELLAFRAQQAVGDSLPKPWPEFAEFDCFACHHHLSDPSWRQTKKHYGGSLPGSLPGNDWYYSVPRALADADLKADFVELAKAIRQPVPPRVDVEKKARQLSSKLAAWAEEWKANPPDMNNVRTVLLQQDDLSWDQAGQLYLVLVAMDAARGEPKPSAALADLYRALLFPRDENAVYDSPPDYRPSVLADILQKLRK